MLKRSILLAATALSAVLSIATPAVANIDPKPTVNSASPAQISGDAVVAILAGISKLKAKDYVGAKSDFNAAISNPAFSDMTPRQRYSAYYLLAMAEFGLKENAEAYDHLQLAGRAMPEARDSDYWFFTCDVALKLNKDDVLADALTHVVVETPSAAADLNPRYIFMVLRRAAALNDGDTHRQRLLEALWAAHFKPADPVLSSDGLWFDLFEIYADKGMDEKAREIAKAVEAPTNILSMRVDNRYRPFLTVTKSQGDYKSALEASLAKSHNLVADNPRSLSASIYLSLALLEANRLDEAMEVLEAAIAKAETAPKNAPAFDDIEDQMNWALDTRTRILGKYGRWSEAEAAQKKARDVAVASGDDIVSQTINLGDFYFRAGQPLEALNEVKDVSKGASPYGLMEAEGVRACAYYQLKDTTNLAKSLEYIRAHKTDDMPATIMVMQCTADVDGLTQYIIEQLNDPKTRNEMLVNLQTYLPEPHPLPIDITMEATWTAAAARPEVQAAIKRYGVIESFPIFGPTH